MLAHQIEKLKDNSLVWKLLQYFDTYGQTHLGEVIPILQHLLESDQSPELRRRIALSIQKIDLTYDYDPDLDEAFFSLIEVLLTTTDAMARDLTVRALSEQRIIKSITQNTYLFAGKQKRVIKMIESLFYQPVDEKDVDQGSQSLVLKFNGKDLSNTAFAASANFLGKFLEQPGFIISYIDIFMKITDQYLEEEVFDKEDKNRRIKIHGLWAIHDLDVSKGNFEYEYDPDKKLLGELKKGLLNISSIDSEKLLFEQVCEKIIGQANYVGYIEIIGQVLQKHPNEKVIMMLLYNTDVVQSIELRDSMWYEIFNGYFTTHPEEKENYEEIFLQKQKFELDIIADLCYILPPPRSAWAESQIAAYEMQIAEKHDIPGFKLTVKDNNKITYGSMRGKNEFNELVFLETRKSAVQEILQKLNEWRASHEIMFDYDDKIMKALVSYFQQNSDQLPDFVSEFTKIEKNTQYGMVDNRLLGSLCKGQIDQEKEKYGFGTDLYMCLLNLYNIFHEDTSSKLQIAGILNENECLRDESTGEMFEKNPNVFGQIKSLVIALANDNDPAEEREDSFSLGLNSVRGIGIGLVAVLVFYYPKDENLLQVLREKSDDAISGIQASVIENLVYLIRENYPFCEEIISKFKEKRITVTDGAIIHYMFCLGEEKLESSQELLYLLEKNQDEKIQEGLGKLIGQAFCYGVQLGGIIDEMIQGKFGTVKLVNNFSYEIEHQIPFILGDESRKEMIKPVLDVFKSLYINYEGQNNDENDKRKIHERLSYLYYGTDLHPNHFGILEQHGVFDVVAEYGGPEAQHHLNEYLFKCLQNDYTLKARILELLEKEVEQEEKSNDLLSNNYESEEITKILTFIINKDGRNEQIDKIFDTGLKFGASNFYEMFENFYLNR